MSGDNRDDDGCADDGEGGLLKRIKNCMGNEKSGRVRREDTDTE